jgi:hypothetical protein
MTVAIIAVVTARAPKSPKAATKAGFWGLEGTALARHARESSAITHPIKQCGHVVQIHTRKDTAASPTFG